MNEHTEQRGGWRDHAADETYGRGGPGRRSRGRGPGGRGGGGGRGRPRGRTRDGRMRRGDVRAALLIALLDGPGHGYELIQRIEAKADGRWRPSPGSVYPSLQALADQDLVTSHEHDGKRIFEITDAGRTEADARIEASGIPWEEHRSERGELHNELRGLHLAAKQAVAIGSHETHTQVAAILRDARKAIYRLLADS